MPLKDLNANIFENGYGDIKKKIIAFSQLIIFQFSKVKKIFNSRINMNQIFIRVYFVIICSLYSFIIVTF